MIKKSGDVLRRVPSRKKKKGEGGGGICIKDTRTGPRRTGPRKKPGKKYGLKEKEKKPVGHDAAHKDVAHVVVEVVGEL